MKKIVLSYNFQSGQVGWVIWSQEQYDSITKTYPNYKEQLIDSEINPFGKSPLSVSIDLYEDAELVEVDSRPGSIEWLLGKKTTILNGTYLETIEIVDNSICIIKTDNLIL